MKKIEKLDGALLSRYKNFGRPNEDIWYALIDLKDKINEIISALQEQEANGYDENGNPIKYGISGGNPTSEVRVEEIKQGDKILVRAVVCSLNCINSNTEIEITTGCGKSMNVLKTDIVALAKPLKPKEGQNCECITTPEKFVEQGNKTFCPNCGKRKK